MRKSDKKLGYRRRAQLLQLQCTLLWSELSFRTENQLRAKRENKKKGGG